MSDRYERNPGRVVDLSPGYLWIKNLHEFLTAVEKRLPTEATIAKDKARKKVKK